MIKWSILVTTAAILAFAATTAAPAQDFGGRPLRFGNTGGWSYDGRGDDRDFAHNGVFPGNFAADPAAAAIGAAGIFGSTPWRSAMPYPSQVVIDGSIAAAGRTQGRFFQSRNQRRERRDSRAGF